MMPIISFVFPILYVAIMGAIFNVLSQITPSIILPAVWSIGIITTTLICIPQMIFEMQHSIVIKRLGMSKYKPWMFYSIMVLYFAIINLISYFCLIGVSYLVLLDNHIFVTNLLTNANYPEVLFALLMTFLTGLSIGLFLVSVSKTILQIQIIGSIILLISLLLAGMIMPIAMCYSNVPYRCMTFISPFTYTNSMLTEAWFYNQVPFNTLTSSIFSPGDVYMSSVIMSSVSSLVLFTSWQKWMNLLIPVILIISLMGFSLNKLSFNKK